MHRLTILLVTACLSVTSWTVAAAVPAQHTPAQRSMQMAGAAKIAVGKKSQRSRRKIDLNLATSKQLQQLKGIGQKRAEAIVRYRQQHGPFTRITQLFHIKGIGSKLLKKLQQQITFAAAHQPKRCPVQPTVCRQ
ncbi:MAG: helix-hairpin-helix domain-containing protein [Myxococcota bacterium]